MRRNELRFPVSRGLKAVLISLALVTAAWATTETAIYAFQGGSNDGYYPESALVTDKAGNLYGTYPYGGTTRRCNSECGFVFKITP